MHPNGSLCIPSVFQPQCSQNLFSASSYYRTTTFARSKGWQEQYWQPPRPTRKMVWKICYLPGGSVGTLAEKRGNTIHISRQSLCSSSTLCSRVYSSTTRERDHHYVTRRVLSFCG